MSVSTGFIRSFFLFLLIISAVDVFAIKPCPPLFLFGGSTFGDSSCGVSSAPARIDVEGYFLNSTQGNDNNAGSAPDEAWRSLTEAGVSLGTNDTGSDIWLTQNSSYEDQSISLDSSGTAGNPSVLGCFELVNNEPKLCQY